MSKKKPTMREQIEDLRAELAYWDARTAELETQNAALQKRIDEGDFRGLLWLREDLRNAGIADHVGIQDGVRELAAASKGSIRLAAHRDALEQKDRYIQQLRSAARDAEEAHEDSVAEVEKWKGKAEREGEARWRAEGELNDWKVTAQNLAKTLEEANKKYWNLLESVPQAGVRNSIKRRLNKFWEVTR